MAQQIPQPDGNERRRDQDDELVRVEDDVMDEPLLLWGGPEARRHEHELCVRYFPMEGRDSGFDDPMRKRGNCDEQSDGCHDLGRLSSARQGAQNRDIQEHPKKGAEHQQAKCRRRDDGPVKSGVQFVIQERRSEGVRPVREVVDACCGIRKRQTGRYERVDRTRHCSRDREGQKLVHESPTNVISPTPGIEASRAGVPAGAP